METIPDMSIAIGSALALLMLLISLAIISADRVDMPDYYCD